VRLQDALRVDEGRYWSYLCTEPACCPAEGLPVNTGGHPAAAALAETGLSAAASRDALAATIAPVQGTEADAMREATARAEDAFRQLAGTNPAALVTTGLAAVQDAITTYRAGRPLAGPDEYARLAFALTSLRIRDDAWARMDPVHHLAHTRLWTDVTRHAQPGYIAAPASLLAFTAWQAGHGALANLAVDRALHDDPAYSMAHLLRDALAEGLPPTLARLPMTPEEVAASYDSRQGRA